MDIGVLPGDGIGPEVINEALRVLNVVRPDIVATTYSFGASHFHKTGELLPDSAIDDLRQHDALLLGAVGDPSVPSGVLERGLLLKLRFALDHHVNLRPSKLYAGASGPLRAAEEINLVVVREGTEGPYAGTGGAIRVGSPHEIATEVSTNTRFGVERVVNYAFRVAADRAGQLTFVHKTNVLGFAGALWARTVEDVSARYPEVVVTYMHVDAATIHLVTRPETFDVIVTDNLFGDILTDLAAAITGGIGLAASGNIDSSGANPAMFEPVHGSAPDIAGRQLADPTAAIFSAALMLRHLGDIESAKLIEDAVAHDIASVGRNIGRRSTEQTGAAIVRAIGRTCGEPVPAGQD